MCGKVNVCQSSRESINFTILLQLPVSDIHAEEKMCRRIGGEDEVGEIIVIGFGVMLF